MLSSGLGMIIIGIVGIAGIAGIVGLGLLLLRHAAGAGFAEDFARAEIRARGRAEALPALHGWDEPMAELTDPGLHWAPVTTELDPFADEPVQLAPAAVHPAEHDTAAIPVITDAGPPRELAAKLVLALPGERREVREGRGQAGDWLTARYDVAMAEVRDSFEGIWAAYVGDGHVPALG